MDLARELKKYCLSNKIKIVIHKCSLCNYPCGYIFSDEYCYYDSGCDCLKQNYNIDQRPFFEFYTYINKLPDSVKKEIEIFLSSKNIFIFKKPLNKLISNSQIDISQVDCV